MEQVFLMDSARTGALFLQGVSGCSRASGARHGCE